MTGQPTNPPGTIAVDDREEAPAIIPEDAEQLEFDLPVPPADPDHGEPSPDELREV